MKNFKLLGVAIAAGTLLIAGPATAEGNGDIEEREDVEQLREEDDVGEVEEIREEDDAEWDEDSEYDTDSEYEREYEREEIRVEEEEDAAIESDTDPMAEPEAIDDPYDEPEPLVTSDEPDTLTPFGMGVTLGGGVNGFTDGDFRDFVDTGGGWEGRLIFGTRTLLGFEAAYNGSANGLDTFGVENDAILLSNGVEGVFRLNLADAAVSPYVLAGAGWKHYEITNTDVNTSSLENSDNVIEFPLGAGLNYRYDRFIADLRGTFRPAVDNELLRSEVAQEENELHSWRAGANVGFEF